MRKMYVTAVKYCLLVIVLLIRLESKGQANFFKYQFSVPEDKTEKYIYIKANVNKDPMVDIDGESITVQMELKLDQLDLPKFLSFENKLKEFKKDTSVFTVKVTQKSASDPKHYEVHLKENNGEFRDFVNTRLAFKALSDSNILYNSVDISSFIATLNVSGVKTTNDLKKGFEIEKAKEALKTNIDTFNAKNTNNKIDNIQLKKIITDLEVMANYYKSKNELDLAKLKSYLGYFRLEQKIKLHYAIADWDWKFDMKDLNQNEAEFVSNFIAWAKAMHEKLRNYEVVQKFDNGNVLSEISKKVNPEAEKTTLTGIARKVYIQMKWAYDMVNSRAPRSGTMYLKEKAKVIDVTGNYQRPWVWQWLSTDDLGTPDLVNLQKKASKLFVILNQKANADLADKDYKSNLEGLLKTFPSCNDNTFEFSVTDLDKILNAYGSFINLNRQVLLGEINLTREEFKTLQSALIKASNLNSCDEIVCKPDDNNCSDNKEIIINCLSNFSVLINDFNHMWELSKKINIEQDLAELRLVRINTESELEYYESLNTYLENYIGYLDFMKGKYPSFTKSKRMVKLKRNLAKDPKNEQYIKKLNIARSKSHLKKRPARKLRKFGRDIQRINSYTVFGDNIRKIRFKTFRSKREYFKKAAFSQYKCRVKGISMAIQDGLIEDIVIKAEVKIEKEWKVVDFTNTHEIPFSTKKNFHRLDLAPLYSTTLIEGRVYRIFLNDFMTYVHAQQNGSYDFSPANGVYDIKVEDCEGKVLERDFFKEPTAQIIRAKVYTDFIGLEESNPNGLIQVEFSKLIPLASSYIRPTHYFRYIEPVLIVSKVEKNNRQLRILEYEVEKTQSIGYVSTLNLLQYANAFIGADLNIVQLAAPLLKSKFELNTGLYAYRTDLFLQEITEKIITNGEITERITRSKEAFTKNTFSWNIVSAYWRIRPEPRYKVDISTKLFCDRLFSDRVSIQEEVRLLDQGQIRSINEINNRLYWTPQMSFSFCPDKKSEYYFRATAFKTLTDRSWDYFQLQFGYSYFFTKNIVK